MIFTQIGLIIALFISWQAIEWTSDNDDGPELAKVNMNALLENDVPVTERPKNTPPPPPPPPPAVKTPEVLEVVEDDKEIEEVVIESTESDQNDIIAVDEVQAVAPVEEVAKVPFMVIENPPVFPGCEKFDTKKEKKECMSAKIQEFVMDEFDTDLAGELGLSGMNRITVLFVIDSKGNVVDVRAHAPHPRLAAEAEEIVKSLPHMKPGKQRGKAVEVAYTLPIIFRVQ